MISKYNIHFSNFQSKLEESVFNRLKDAIPSEQGFELKHNCIFRTTYNRRMEIDIILFKNGDPYVIFEIKDSIERDLSKAKDKTRENAIMLKSPYFIICNNLHFYLYESLKMTCKDVQWEWNISNIETCILHSSEKDSSEGLSDLIVGNLKDEWMKILEDLKLESRTEIESIIQSLDKTDFICHGNSLALKSQKEDQMFLAILGKTQFKTLCRYSSLTSLFRIIDTKEQSMCSLVCMNDKSETNYALSKQKEEIEILDSETLNDCYILSCCNSDMKDNLLMYRLYAADATGVCTLYDIDQEKVNQKNFFLAKVNYGQKDNSHPELSFIQRIQKSKINNRIFSCNRLSIWKHFFKPYEYKDEKEVRLLYYDKGCISSECITRWIHNDSYKIIAPIKIFKIDKDNKDVFPLHIKQIILGPKSSDGNINTLELKAMIQDKKIRLAESSSKDSLVSESHIDNYR